MKTLILIGMVVMSVSLGIAAMNNSPGCYDCQKTLEDEGKVYYVCGDEGELLGFRCETCGFQNSPNAATRDGLPPSFSRLR